METAPVYEETQASLSRFVRTLSAGELGTTVPATPDWSVRDVVAHLAQEASFAAVGNVPPEFSLVDSVVDPAQAEIRERLNAEEVGRRRGMPFERVVDEWDAAARRLLPMFRGEEPFPWPAPFLDSILVADLAGHGQDVRNALGRPGERDTAACRIGLASMAVGLGFRLDARGIAPLLIRYDGRDRICGTGEPAATLTADRYEMFRALSGRRSRAQIAAYEWEGDPSPYLSVIPPYGERVDDLIEPEEVRTR